MNKGYSFLLVACLTAAVSSTSFAAGENSLPSDLQDLKSDVLTLNRDVSQLENELLFPSSSTTILVGVNAGSKLRLVDVKLSIDDQIVSYHAYSEQETVALSKGGLQRLYMGNVNSGSHNIQAVITAYDANGKDFQRTVNYTFSKNSLRKIVEIKAGDDVSNAQPAVFNFREWESKN
ncbi:hypothetical protein [Agitococcus lubricus]|uniref:AraC family transcriptional regulator n=1 Tax=Agitococcus lubricus TaxID=1077255 RepID=A0A2T5IWC0_9GAMM|nr:hypothetical protein [Agitococcus lubricus]PTQ88181.1 hypothetical protein C8N29_11441 [Agitococcus lubricus]